MNCLRFGSGEQQQDERHCIPDSSDVRHGERQPGGGLRSERGLSLRVTAVMGERRRVYGWTAPLTASLHGEGELEKLLGERRTGVGSPTGD